MYDAIIIGSGVTGSAVAMYLSKYKGKFLVLEKNEDVATGTSKANTAIIHAGYDAKIGSNKAKMNVKGSQMMQKLAKDLNFPYKKMASLVVSTNEEEKEILYELKERGEKNGVKNLEILQRDELLKMDKNLSDKVNYALVAYDCAIVDPFLMNCAFAEVSYENGVSYEFNNEVKSFRKEKDHWIVITEKNEYKTKAVVNCAGVYADNLHNMVSDLKFNIKARRGEYLLLDKSTEGFVNHVIFDVPTSKGKGVVITPTIDGNTLVGPTANFIEDKADTSTTREEIDKLIQNSSKTMKDIPLNQVITSFSGLRAHEETRGDFVLEESVDGFFDCLGIESPGLSSSPAIGEYMALKINEKLKLQEKENFILKRDPIVKTSEISKEEHQKLVQENPAYGRIICRCEKVTEGEIIDAIRRNPGATTIDGVKRRVRATAGRCQGGFCTPKIIEIMAREMKVQPKEILKNSKGSYLILRKTK